MEALQKGGKIKYILGACVALVAAGGIAWNVYEPKPTAEQFEEYIRNKIQKNSEGHIKISKYRKIKALHKKGEIEEYIVYAKVSVVLDSYCEWRVPSLFTYDQASFEVYECADYPPPKKRSGIFSLRDNWVGQSLQRQEKGEETELIVKGVYELTEDGWALKYDKWRQAH